MEEKLEKVISSIVGRRLVTIETSRFNVFYKTLEAMSPHPEIQLDLTNLVLPSSRPQVTSPRIEKTTFDPQENLVKELEQWIDAMDSTLPPLKNFILPVNPPLSKLT